MHAHAILQPAEKIMQGMTARTALLHPIRMLAGDKFLFAAVVAM